MTLHLDFSLFFDFDSPHAGYTIPLVAPDLISDSFHQGKPLQLYIFTIPSPFSPRFRFNVLRARTIYKSEDYASAPALDRAGQTGSVCLWSPTIPRRHLLVGCLASFPMIPPLCLGVFGHLGLQARRSEQAEDWGFPLRAAYEGCCRCRILFLYVALVILEYVRLEVVNRQQTQRPLHTRFSRVDSCGCFSRFWIFLCSLLLLLPMPWHRRKRTSQRA